MELKSFSGEANIDRDGGMKGTGNRIFGGIRGKNSGGTGKGGVDIFYWRNKKGTDDSTPLMFDDMGGVFCFSQR